MRMLGYDRPCACCGRHGVDTPIGKEHLARKRAQRRREKQAWRRELNDLV